MTIRYIAGNTSILDSGAGLLVCPVNTQSGVMGAGLAKAFAARWPALKSEHRKAVEHGDLSIGRGCLVQLRGGSQADFLAQAMSPPIFLLPTKDDWRNPSRLEWIESGLESLAACVAGLSSPDYVRPLRSCAVPALGTGLGGLSWADVRPLVERTAEGLPGVEWMIYGPKGE
jgi:O-acetyl-ADP-ribose deacetylase (regulator of RNase III)